MAPGETGALVARLQSYGELLCLVAGAWGETYILQTCAERKVEHLCRSTGSPELEGQLSVIVSQYRRLLSTCESTGSMPDLKGWRHHTPGERGSAEARGGWQDGETAERGPSSTVDGKRQGARVG